MSTTLADDSFSSAFMAGFGNEESEVFGETVKKWVDGAIQAGSNALRKAKELISKGSETIKKAKDFFTEWMKDDPLGATAGAAAVLLGGVIIVSVGAAVIATGSAVAAGSITATTIGTSVVGGIAGLLTMKTLVLGALGIGAGGIAMALGRFFVSGRQFLSNFNWQVTDKELDQQGKSQLDGFFGSLGSALGVITGNLVCGGVAGAVVMKFNPQAALHIRAELGEEVYEEVMSAIWGLANQTKSLVQGWLFRNAFKSARRIIKNAVRNSFFLQGILGEDRTELIKNWGAEGNQPWTFTRNFEEWIESIDNVRLRNFTENFFEEFFDSCDEAIMVATGSVSQVRYP